ncbi:luciferase domain-containing protein [Dyadobacter frigoris]|uniref:Luciferase domain-containing protein n=1 Tax=Dyadobacter frigoris TaxID=2576211 RepID=A0A4U6D5K9_9BACT|nr:luciferase family protein [Dyadobacter frigoris]TKT92602.1 hypothetical protein FDK13_07205 [Dyadobacter frigoris]GLU51488.1 hypothetical protein Dfri01_09490 [Dyadobacter frigoris]
MAILVSAQKPDTDTIQAVNDPVKIQAAVNSDIQKSLTPAEYQDYLAWVALGIGGLPHTPEGYRTVKKIGMAMKDPLDVSRITPYIGKKGDLASLKNLPKRLGSKPSIAPFAVPHRQTNQHNTEQIRKKQTELFDTAVEGSHGQLIYRNSYLEKHSPGIFLADPAKGNQTVVGISHAEIGHIHAFDGSMHLIISPSDTKEVIDKGWGELHGLANGEDKVARTYMLIYSPRDENELAVTNQILDAAIKYSSYPAHQ